MSGTSADGVDVAIVAITGHGLDMKPTLVRHHHRPYNESLRSEIFAFRGDRVRDNFLSRLARMGREISLTCAAAVNEALTGANMSAADLAAVAAHGQTLFHDPPDTIQWFDASLVAAEVGCPVVSDFRRADLAAGGQGAPLVPFADYILFRDPTKSRVLLNIGGIANITFIPAGATIRDVIAFDTGPGNCLSDHLCRTLDPTGPGFDTDGASALAGERQSDALLADLLVWEHPFFRARPPKSTDGPAMIRAFEDHVAKQRPGKAVALPAALATAAFVTVHSIHKAVGDFLPAMPDEVIVAGGGTRNRMIMKYLAFEWPPKVIDIASFEIPADAKEALAFALLGAATLDGVPSNVPSATGARRAVVLGSITSKP
jgi:anhydro-N-acetylmuramic acid kinase